MSETHHHEEHETHEGHADESPWEIMTDPGHLAAELVFEGFFFILGALWVKWRLRNRDVDHGHTYTSDRRKIR